MASEVCDSSESACACKYRRMLSFFEYCFRVFMGTGEYDSKIVRLDADFFVNSKKKCAY